MVSIGRTAFVVCVGMGRRCLTLRWLVTSFEGVGVGRRLKARRWLVTAFEGAVSASDGV